MKQLLTPSLDIPHPVAYLQTMLAVIIQFVIRGPLIKGQYGYKIMKSITLKLESGLEKAKVNMYYNIFSVLQTIQGRAINHPDSIRSLSF